MKYAYIYLMIAVFAGLAIAAAHEVYTDYKEKRND